MFISEWLLSPPHLCIYNTKSCSSSSSFLHHSHSLQGAKVLDLFGDPRYQTIATFTDTSADGKALNLQVSLFSGGTEEERQQDMSKCDIAISGHMSGVKVVFVSLFIKRLQVSR